MTRREAYDFVINEVAGMYTAGLELVNENPDNKAFLLHSFEMAMVKAMLEVLRKKFDEDGELDEEV